MISFNQVTKVAILGCGNMGSAFALGLMQANSRFHFYTYTPSSTRAVDLAKKLSGEFIKHPSELPETELVILACKPQNIEDLLDKFKGKIEQAPFVISLLAGTSYAFLKRHFNQSSVIRVMPNTPALVRKGVNLIYGPDLFPKDSEALLHLLNQFSKNLELRKEEDFDYLTGVSGSGPAYVFEIIRILAAAFEGRGISKTLAQDLAAEVVDGAVKLFKDSREEVTSLRSKVVSTGGVTAEALDVLKESGLETIFMKAIDAAFRRSKELGRV
jgi:pyrroline-5-carboxylate reductase